jgi:serine/threonine-protein kinase
MHTAEHPSADELAAFGLGKLTPGEMAAIERHIAACDRCCHTLRDVRDDTMVDLARAAVCQDETGTLAFADAATIDSSIIEPHTAFDEHPRYRLLSELGAGGMGVVYKAEHRLMERTVALKVINRRFTANKLALDRFRREVKAAAKLHHPNIVAAFDADQAGELHFLVMEFVPGISLGQLVTKQGPMPVHQACRCIVQAAQGLQHAHEHGMVHRDIKPHNLMVTKAGQVKILDFGLARLGDDLEGDARLTGLDTVVGTPDFLAPEQARNSRGVDVRADVYSLGCTLYFLLTGQPPHPEGSAIEKMLRHCERDADPVEELRPDVPAALAEVVRKMMARLPEDRYQTAKEAAVALTPFMRPQGATPARPAQPGRPPAPAAAPAPKPAGAASPTAKEKPRAPSRRGDPSRGWPRAAVIAAALVGVTGLGGLTAWMITRQPAGETANGAAAPRGQSRASNVTVAPDQPPRPVLYILPAQGLWYPDFGPVKVGLEAKGYTVKVASSQPGFSELAMNSPGQKVPVDVVLDGHVRAADYAALIFAGLRVQEYCDERFPQCLQVRRLIAEMQQIDRPVAALCTGQLVLASAGTLQGKRVALNDKIPMIFPKHGAIAESAGGATADGNLVTGARPEDGPAFTSKLLQRLQAQPLD